MKKNLLIIFILLILSIPSVISLLHPGFFQSDDGEWMIIRFSAFYQALADGQFPVRFLGRLNHEFGYPVANFLYPGFMYLGVPIHFLGIGFVDTIKIIFGVSMISSAVFCFLWLQKFFDRFSSIIGALFYLYAPYHLFDLYKRGSVGEILALAVVPFILWQIERKSLFWTSIGVAFMILAHNTLAVLFLPLTIVYLIIQRLRFYSSRERSDSRSLKVLDFARTIVILMVPVLIGIGLSAFFWIPAIFELHYTIFFQTQVSNWGAYFADIPNIDTIGFSTIFILLLTAVFFFTSVINIQKHRLTLLLFIVGILSVFLSSSWSYHLWNILPVSFIQFPFRFLSLTIICVSFLAAFLVNNVVSRHSGERSDSRISFVRQGYKRFWTSQNDDVKRFAFGTILIILLATSSFPYLRPSDFFDKGEGFYATNMGTTTVQDEYMPKWVKEKPTERFGEKVEIVNGDGMIGNVFYNSKKITFDVFADENMRVRINTIYYPGWNTKVNNQLAEIDFSNEKGVMELDIPKGENVVELKFSETPLRLFADFFSIISVIFLLFSRSIIKRYNMI